MQRNRALALAIATALSAFGFAPADTAMRPGVTQLLPDLAVLAPFEFRIETTDGRRLLRFSTVVVNIGKGPFQLYGFDPNGVTGIGHDLQVLQQILQSDGTFRTRPTSATIGWAADGHNHFHVADLQWIRIRDLNTGTLRSSAKTGFCFLDSYPYGGKKSSRYNSANFVCQVAPNRTVPMGISVQWGDVYRSTIAFQWIDITGLPSGDYLVEIIADPPRESGGRFLESNESNNRGWTRIRLTKNGVRALSESAPP